MIGETEVQAEEVAGCGAVPERWCAMRCRCQAFDAKRSRAILRAMVVAHRNRHGDGDGRAATPRGSVVPQRRVDSCAPPGGWELAVAV